MTTSDGTPVDIVALAEERRRLETWIRALEHERDATPPHIYDRVHADYATRLERVTAALSEHEGALRDEAVRIEPRLALLEGELQLRVDRRAELGLRASVGEILPEERDAALAGLDQEIQQLVSERDALRDRQQRLQALLTPGADVPRAPIITPPPPTRGEARQSDPEFAAPAPRPSRAMHPPIHTPPRPSIPAPRPSAAAGPSAPTRPSTQAPSAKTLKCAECGAMNYPTEWYCERCGAELSAL